MRFAHHISLRKALYDVKNEIANKTTWKWLHFYIKKGQPQMIEIVLFLCGFYIIILSITQRLLTIQVLLSIIVSRKGKANFASVIFLQK